MCFWKIFAWIAFVWTLLFRRGKGVSVKKRSAQSSEGEPQGASSGKGWRLVSTRRFPEPEVPEESPPSAEEKD